MYGSLKFGLVVYMLTFVGAIFNTLTLLTIGWVLSFILPKVLYKVVRFYLSSSWLFKYKVERRFMRKDY